MNVDASSNSIDFYIVLLRILDLSVLIHVPNSLPPSLLPLFFPFLPKFFPFFYHSLSTSLIIIWASLWEKFSDQHQESKSQVYAVFVFSLEISGQISCNAGYWTQGLTHAKKIFYSRATFPALKICK